MVLCFYGMCKCTHAVVGNFCWICVVCVFYLHFTFCSSVEEEDFFGKGDLLVLDDGFF